MARLNSQVLNLGLCLVLFGSVLSFGMGGDFERPKAMAVLLGASLLAPRALLNWQSAPVWPRYTSLLWLFGIVLSTLFALDPFRALIGSFERSQGLLLLLACTVLAFARVPASRLLMPIIALSYLTAAWCIFQVFGWQLSWATAFEGRAFAGFGNPTAMAGWLVMALTFLSLQHGSVNSGLAKASLNGAIFSAALALLLSGTRAAWLAVAVVALWSAKERVMMRAPAIIAAGLVLTALLCFRPESLASRWQLWSAASGAHSLLLTDTLGRADQHPNLRLWLGTGEDLQVAPIEQLLVNLPSGVVADRAHQWLLDAWLTSGVFGTLTAALLAISLWRAWPKPKITLCPIIAALIAWQFGFALTAEKALFALMIGAGFALPDAAEAKLDWSWPAWSVTAFASLLIALSYLPIKLTQSFYTPPWRKPELAIVHFRNAQSMIARGNGILALRELNSAQQLDPWRRDIARAHDTLAKELGHNPHHE